MVVVVVANISVWTGKTGRTGVCSVTAASQVRRLGCELRLQSAGEGRGGEGGDENYCHFTNNRSGSGC